HHVNLTAGQPVRVRALSTAFDTYLIVRAPSGPQRDNDDVSPQDRNAGLDYTPIETGAHTVLVTSYRPGETGSYQVTLEPIASGTPPLTAPTGGTPPAENNGVPAPVVAPGDPMQAAAGAGALAPSAPTMQQGELAQGDHQLRTGEFMDEYSFQWPAGARVHLEARSDRFDTYLFVRSPSGRQQDNDDGVPGTTNAALDLLTSEAGTWTVSVTSYRAGEVGPYQLSVNAGGAGAAAAGAVAVVQPDPGVQPAQPAVGTTTPTPAFEPLVGPGASGASGATAPAPNGTRVVEGNLAQGDQQLRTGEFTESHTMQFRPGETVRFRLDSTHFDAYLIVRPPSGHQLDNDDLAPGSTNAGVDVPVAEAGDYTVMVTSYRPGETGAYTLRVEHGVAGSLPAAQSAAVLQGGPAAGQLVAAAQAAANGGRVFGVFAGVTDYPEGINDLSECANDARKIDQALTRRGLITPDQRVVLTDSQATVANVRAAMQQMASRVGPNDVFMFFWSGHGGRVENVRSPDPREIDGIDEYIYLYDGRMLDDEMGTLFDGINARVSVLALDSCFAGGFAKDVITRPGRVGLFSSEEDVTSAVAQQFQAGGYLSHFLQTGIEGEGDADPHDGVLTVGELTFYLYSHFGAHAS
ncbi:MAG: caspase family protein, partial [Deltaproteobacteria bacterium]